MWRAADSFRLQIGVIGLASLSMAALAVLLVQDVLGSARQTILRDAQQQCATAARELAEQFAERASLPDNALEALPPEAQDLSLRGLAAAVLRSFEGVEGGFYARRILGHAGALSEGEAKLIARLAERAVPRAAPVSDSLEQDRAAVVAAAVALGSRHTAAWALKRLHGLADPASERRRWWLAGLVISALLGLGGLISISIRLRRGVHAVNEALRRLEKDFDYRMPAIGGDFGTIARAINQMAERRTALERSLRQQDRLAALGKVVAGVAHEIRNPLNSIRLALELLDRRVRRGAAGGEEVRGAMEEVDKLDRILARLLAFGRPGADHRQLQDLRPLIERAIRMVQEQSQRKGVRIAVSDCDGPLAAEVDALQIEQVLINLLLNAIEASPEGSTVRLRVEAAAGALRVAVHDEGPGVAEEIREHVFDPYFTTKENGHGLGLAISREVAANHGGTLELKPGAGGATFVLTLPMKRSAG